MRQPRGGFTLIEMLVAMALTLFIMAILSQAFVAGLDTFRGLKAIGDMQQGLRAAMTVLRDDLSQDHFEGGRKLSDPQMNANNRPKEGYFYIRQATALGSAFYVAEGVDADGIASYRATDHSLAFTIKRRGNKRENVMMTYDIVTFPPPAAGNPQPWSPLSLTSSYYLNQRRDALHNPGGPPGPSPYFNPDVFASQWAEVGYFLVKTGTTDEPENPASVSGVSLHNLYRTQYLLVPNIEKANAPAVDNDPVTKDTTEDKYLQSGFYAGISCIDPTNNAGDRLVFNSPVTVMNPANRVAFNPRKATLVCANVVSFQVQAMPVGQPTFGDVSAYDTSLTPVPLSALKVTIRIYDTTTRFARQLSLVNKL